MIVVRSFSYKKGVPAGTRTAYDCRGLPNPFRYSSLRCKNGLDPQVRDFVLSNSSASSLIRKAVATARTQGHVALGCVGGHHRSVVIAEAVAEELRRQKLTVMVEHLALQPDKSLQQQE